MTPLTKDERWEIYRLAKQARGGLYTAEKQALVFISDAQTMQNGVCSKALENGADLGYSRRALQWGIHGKHRNGKVEYPGLLARGIVSASGYVKGGRAPGGKGLTATYSINCDVLLTFVPEVDDDSPIKKGETLGETLSETLSETLGETLSETLGETSSKKGETKGDLMHTRSYSSSLTPPSIREASDPPGESSSEAREGKGEMPVVVVGEASAQREDESQRLGQKKSEAVSIEEQHDRLIAASRARQLDRNQTDAEIYRDYKAVYDQLKRNNPLQASKKHRHDAANLYRAIGREAALEKWRYFLVNEDHDTTTGIEIFDEESGAPTGRFYSEDVERTWLLHDFVLNCSPT
jgi:hypothetical protein